MTKIKEYIKNEATRGEVADLRRVLASALSEMVSATDSQIEHMDEVRFTEHPSRDGLGYYLVGEIDRDAFAEYMTQDLPPEEYEVRGAQEVIVHDPTDLDEQEFEQHMQIKHEKGHV